MVPLWDGAWENDDLVCLDVFEVGLSCGLSDGTPTTEQGLASNIHKDLPPKFTHHLCDNRFSLVVAFNKT